MGKRVWEITLGGNKHTVHLDHGTLSGTRRIWVDGQLIEDSRKFFDSGFLHSFSLDGHSCELGIFINGLAFDCWLRVDDSLVEPVQGTRMSKFLRKAIQSSQDENIYWQDLEKETGLAYNPVLDVRDFGRHRLVGKVHGYLTVVRFGWIDTRQVVISVLVRYAPLVDPERVKNQIKDDPAIKRLLEKWWKRAKDSWQVQDGYAWIMLPYKPKKETAAQMAAKIIEFVGIVAKYAKPLSETVCEGRDCQSPLNQYSRKLVFVNGMPFLFCSNCLAKTSDIGDRAKFAYEEMPSGLLRGFLAGLVGSVIGSILWVVITVLFDRVGAVFAAFILTGLVWIMDRVRTKRTIWSILLAAVLAVISVVAGTYMTILWHTWREFAMPLSIDVLSKVWQFMLMDSKMLKISLFISLFGIVPYLWIIRSKHKEHLSFFFDPNIEVLDSF
ncbi:MAG: hypothetical protein GY832_18270 [Chloroflexi bacterium]|nr:hypothetical protein [Chloroflexota bacterium]